MESMQEIMSNLTSSSQKADYIKNLDDDKVKLDFINQLDTDYDKLEVIESMSQDDVKIQAINSLNFDKSKAKAMKTINDLDKIIKNLSMISNDSDKIELGQDLPDDYKILIMKTMTENFYVYKLFQLITSEQLKIDNIDLLAETDKAKFISSLNDNQTKLNLISKLETDLYRLDVIEKLPDNLKALSLSFLSNDNYKRRVIISLEDDQSKLKLLDQLNDDYNRLTVIKSMSEDNIKIQAIEKLKSKYNIKKALELITNYDLIVASNAFDDLDWSDKLDISINFPDDIKLKIIKEITEEEIIMVHSPYGTRRIRRGKDITSIRDLVQDTYGSKSADSLTGYQLDQEKYILQLIESLKDEQQKKDCLSYLKLDISKLKIISNFSTQELKYDSLFLLKDNENKYQIISSFTDEELKIKSLPLLLDDAFKVEIIKTFSSDEKKLSFVDNIHADRNKSSIIQSLNSDELKLKSLTYINDVNEKLRVINSIDDIDLIIDNKDSISSFINSNIHILINDKSDEDKLKMARAFNDSFSDFDQRAILVSLTNDKLKLENLDLLEGNDNFKAMVISTISDDQIKFDSLSRIQNEYFKVTIIETINGEELFYKAFSQIKDDYNRSNILSFNKNDQFKYKYLHLIESDLYASRVVNSITDEKLKIAALKQLKEDDNKISIISELNNDQDKMELLDILEDNKSKFEVIFSMKDSDMKEKSLSKIENYEETMRFFFKEGQYKFLDIFNNNILNKIFDSNQIKVLNNYSNIQNNKIKEAFSAYTSSHYDVLNMDNIDKVADILLRIEMSNSSELQSFGDVIASQVLNSSDPVYYFNKVENIFVKNNIPEVGKIYEVFKALHSNQYDYRNYSPLLNRFKDSKHATQMMDLVIYNDLLKCAAESNNRSLNSFIRDIENGNRLLIRVVNDPKQLMHLSDEESVLLNKYFKKTDTILDSYDKWKNKNTKLFESNNDLERIELLKSRLKIHDTALEDVPNILIKKFCGLKDIKTLDEFKRYCNSSKEEANQRNRLAATKDFTLEEGDFVKGINDFKYLPRILQNGSVSKEFLGAEASSDATPLDTDLSRVLKKNIDGKDTSSLGQIINSTRSGNGLYGNIWFVLKNNPMRIDITRDNNHESIKNISRKFSKLEAFKTLEDGHYGIRTGFPSSEISYIVSSDNFDKIGLEVAMNGFYIPVVDTNGKLVFSPDDYDKLREKMQGLTYYDEKNYEFSTNLINDDILKLANQIDNNNIITDRKRKMIEKKISRCVEELGLKLKDHIDGDLSQGIVELIDTGSTGRHTNAINDGDFDFMMRLDRNILYNQQKLANLRAALVDSFGQKVSYEITARGDIRLKKIALDDGSMADIDISFAQKTDKLSYTTDMCLNDRLNTIRKQDPEKYKYVIANILLAKKVLKDGQAYKTDRSPQREGGLGGVGVENWILQNGGSFIDAANSFLEKAKDKYFDTFKNEYQIWDFGENHMAEGRLQYQYPHDNFQYPHDNFVTCNMSSNGYNKMIGTLEKYLMTHRVSNENNLNNEIIKGL